MQSGGTSVANVFDLAFENDFYPYQYPITKAYEMISCFEGLLEFYRVTKNERYKTAIINFADRILESDFTVIGSSGCTHELFDHSAVRQANTTNGIIMQETCVTVTLMKFFYQLTLLTGEPKYADAFERSLFNAYLGSVNTEKRLNLPLRRSTLNCILSRCRLIATARLPPVQEETEPADFRLCRITITTDVVPASALQEPVWFLR